MKRIALILLLICVLCLSFVGCTAKPLSVPQNLQIQDNILTWDRVDDASGYLVIVNEDEYSVSAPYMELTLQNNKDYSIKVKALGSGKYTDSDFSEVLNYSNKVVSPLTRLNAPNIMEIDGLGNVYWTLVASSKGYKIYKNNILFDTVADPYTTSYKLELTDPGTYSIQVQAIGDNVNYSDSAKSNVYKFVINPDGKPNLPNLNTPEITYNPETESLEWARIRYAVSYFVFLNDTVVATIDSTGDSNYSYKINPNLSTNVFTVTAVGDNISYGMSRKSNSITFPLVPANPPQNLRVEVIDGVPTIIWDVVDFSRGYILDINSKQEKVLTNTFTLDQYTDGEYLVRVLANGDNLFYTSTVFSEQISVKVVDGAIELPRLSAPDYPRYVNSVLYWDSVSGAEKYEIVMETPYDDTVSTLYYTTEETSLSIDSVFEDTVLIFYIRSLGNGYTTSLYSKGLGYVPNATKTYIDDQGFEVTIQGEQYYFAKVPSDIAYDGRVLSWSKVDEASGYVVNINNQSFTTDTNQLEYSVGGSAIVSVSALTEKDKYYNSPKSEEVYIVSPKRLNTPKIELNNKVLLWESVIGASEYILFINGEPMTVLGTVVDLKQAIKVDGKYSLAVVAVSSDPVVYANSLKSREILFTVDYGEYGTKEKPYLLTKYDDFSLLSEHPDAYFKIDVAEIDLSNANIYPLFENAIFTGNLDGNGAVIKNFRINSTLSASGFFGLLGNAEIYNLTFENATVLGGTNVAVISHNATGTNIQNISVKNSIIILSENANAVGGAFARFTGTAHDINIDIQIVKSDIDYINAPLSYIGGFAGVVDGELKGITLSGTITTPQKVLSRIGFLCGELNGSVDGLLINNVTLNSSGTYNGLISGTANANLDNVKVFGTLNSFGVYNGLFGSFKGNFNGTAELAISVNSNEESAYVGAFAGYLLESTVDADIQSTMNVTAGFVRAGGFAGYAYGNIDYKFNNEIALKINSNTGYIGGIFGFSDFASSNVVSGKIDITVDPENQVNILVGAYKGNDNDKCINSNVTLSGNILNHIFMKPKGLGTEESPYLITNYEEFLHIETEPKAYYKLVNSVNVGRGFFKEEAFEGVFDGNGWKIIGVYSNSTYSGLFGKTKNAKIYNLKLEKVDVQGNAFTGGLVGHAIDTEITDVLVTGIISVNYGYAGGVVGQADNCTITRCGFKGTIINISNLTNDEVQDYIELGVRGTIIGGVVSENNSNISDSFAIVNFDGNTNFFGGGFSGRNFGKIQNSYVVGKLLVDYIDFSGFSYGNNGEILNCYQAIDSLYNFTLFTSGLSVGTITNCYYIRPTFVDGVVKTIDGLSEKDNLSAIENGVFDGWENSGGYSLIPYLLEQWVDISYKDITISVSDTLKFNLLDYIDLKQINAFGVGTMELPEGLTYKNGIITAHEYADYVINVTYRDFVMNINISLSETINPDFAEGKGIESNPYIIKDYEALLKSANYVNVYFKLANDIEIAESIKTYQSNLDGAGFSLISEGTIFNTFSGSLTNITLKTSKSETPLIIKAENAELSNVTFDATIIATEYTQYLGAIGIVDNSNIKDITVNVTLNGNATQMGGLTASVEGISSVENITLDVIINGTADYIGGAVGISENNITGVSGNVVIESSTADYIGGVVGTISGNLSNINLTSEITNSNSNISLGGIVGTVYGHLENCYVNAYITSSTGSVVGGVAGSSYDLTDCTAIVAISLTATGGSVSVGGVAGSVYNVSATMQGTVEVLNTSSMAYIGLVAGSCNNATINAEGSLEINSSDVLDAIIYCGTVGYGSVSDSNINIALKYNSNASDTETYFGGATGQGSVSNTEIEVNIQSTDIVSKVYIGGVVGMLSLPVSANTVKGNISTDENVYVGTVAGYGVDAEGEYILDNIITITVDSTNTNGTIGYKPPQENI